MGIGLRVFFVLDDGDRLQRISLKRFDGLWGESKERFPEYAGQSVRYALVVLETRNRKANAIKSVDCGILKFNSKGQIDKDEWRRQFLGRQIIIEDKNSRRRLMAEGGDNE